MAENRTPIECTTCSGKHWTAREVWACGQFGPVANYKPIVLATERQVNYIRDLGGDPVYGAKLDKKAASEYIGRLIADRKKGGIVAANAQATVPQPQPVEWPLMTPRAMVEAMKNGRYAVQPDSLTPLTFVRVSRPKTGKKKGSLVLQTQHSDWYKDCVVIWPSGSVTVLDKRIDSSLLLVVADPTTAAMRYGTKLGVCCSCARELTDERSRYYGIGPECEKSWPEVINRVNDARGVYRPGVSNG